MPVAIAIGPDPLCAIAAATDNPAHVSEVDIAGGLKKEPVNLVKCETNDLYVPATAEIVVEGKKSGKPATHIFEMIDFYDSEKDYTSMGKTTSFPASIAAQMITSGKIARRGSLFPEEVFQSDLYQPLMDALKERGVVVTHKAISN